MPSGDIIQHSHLRFLNKISFYLRSYMLIKELPPESRDKLIAGGFSEDDDINEETDEWDRRGFMDYEIAGQTPLTWAAKRDALLVRALVENGAEINKTNYFKYTPLMIAAQFGVPKIAEYLLESGADLAYKATVHFDGYPVEMDASKISKKYTMERKIEELLGYSNLKETREIIKKYKKKLYVSTAICLTLINDLSQDSKEKLVAAHFPVDNYLDEVE